MKLNKNIIFVLFEGLLFIATLFFIIFSKIDLISALGLLIICLFIPLFILRPYYGMLFILIVRSATDVYTENIFINVLNIAELNFSSILGILIILWCLFIVFREKINLKKIPLFWAWTLFIVCAGASLIYTVNFSDSIRMLTRLVGVYFLYFVSYFYFTIYKNKKNDLIKVIFLSSILPIIFGIYQIILSRGFVGPENMSRVYGTFAHPNAFAFNLFFFFFVFFIQYIYNKNTRYKKLLSVYLSIVLILILFTLTRSVWIGISVLIGFLLVLYKRDKFSKYILAFFTVLFLFIMLVNYTPLKYYDFNDIKFIRRITTSETTLSSWQWRNKMWQEMTSYIYDSPIIGYGIDSYKTLREKQIKDAYESTYAHNDYFRLLIELGIIGLLLYINLIIQTLRNIYKKFLQSKNYKYLISFVGILIIFLISSVDNMLDTTSLLWIMWVYIAYLVSD